MSDVFVSYARRLKLGPGIACCARRLSGVARRPPRRIDACTEVIEERLGCKGSGRAAVLDAANSLVQAKPTPRAGPERSSVNIDGTSRAVQPNQCADADWNGDKDAPGGWLALGGRKALRGWRS
jgi:hypothetical protein